VILSSSLVSVKRSLPSRKSVSGKLHTQSELIQFHRNLTNTAVHEQIYFLFSVYMSVNQSRIFHFYINTEKKTHAVWTPDQNGWVSRRQENSDCSSSEWLEKASWTTPLFLDGHSEERPISAQPTFEDAIEMALDKPLWGLLAASGAAHWWCMPNNDGDDDINVKSCMFLSITLWSVCCHCYCFVTVVIICEFIPLLVWSVI